MALLPGTWHADPSHFCQPNRRNFLYAGWLGGLGLTLGQMLKLEHASAADTRKLEAKAKAVIHIYLQGGFAHMDSFDPKPDAPAEYRGILAPVKTPLPGIMFSEHMEKIAKIADKITVVRSMTHTEVDHSRGEHSMFTGYRPSPALTYPSMGSVTAQQLGAQKNMPPYICVPNQGSQFLGSGYLSSAFGPFSLGTDPGRPGFTVRDLNLPNGVDEKRFQSRREWKDLVDDHFAQLEKDDALDTMDQFYKQAYGLLSSKEAREAFSLKGETTKTKEMYGIGKRDPVSGYSLNSGARFLIARRLIEAGSRFVTLTYGSWDTHAYHYRNIGTMMPGLDYGFSGLIQDLDERGLLDSTLVVLNSEFGRTPKINAGGGRDHWPRVFSILLAGGGIKRGHVFGQSDGLAAEPKNQPLTVENYAHTLYHLLGIDARKDLMSPGNRPQAIVMNGEVEKDLLA